MSFEQKLVRNKIIHCFFSASSYSVVPQGVHIVLGYLSLTGKILLYAITWIALKTFIFQPLLYPFVILHAFVKKYFFYDKTLVISVFEMKDRQRDTMSKSLRISATLYSCKINYFHSFTSFQILSLFKVIPNQKAISISIQHVL